MSLTIAFQMEPMSEVNPAKNNTLYLMHEAQKRGHRILHFTPHELSLHDDTPIARLREVRIHWGEENFYTLWDETPQDFSEIDVVMIRQNPPFNMEYISATYILEKLPKHVQVYNPPQALRDWPEKLIPALLPEFTVPTLISSDLYAIGQFHKQHPTVILKPLYMFGGNDVYRFTATELDSLLERAMDIITRTSSPVIVQRFIPEVMEGDKRLLFIDGDFVGAFLRIPAAGSVRANVAQGGTAQPYTILSERDLEICNTISPMLKQRNILICGIDIIGDYLTEVNITSAMGFRLLDDMYELRTVDKILDHIEEKSRRK